MNSSYTDRPLVPIELHSTDYIRLEWSQQLYVAAYIKAMLDHIEPYLSPLRVGIDFKLSVDDLVIEKYRSGHLTNPTTGHKYTPAQWSQMLERIMLNGAHSIHIISHMNVSNDTRLNMICMLNLLSIPHGLDCVTSEDGAPISIISEAFTKAELYALDIFSSCKYMYSKMLERLKTHTDLLDSIIAAMYHTIKVDMEYLAMYRIFLDHVLLSFGLLEDMEYITTMESLRTIDHEVNAMIGIIEPKQIPRDITPKSVSIYDDIVISKPKYADPSGIHDHGVPIIVPPMTEINVSEAVHRLLHSEDKVVMYMYKPVYTSTTSIFEVINSHTWRDMELLSERVWKSMFIEIEEA